MPKLVSRPCGEPLEEWLDDRHAQQLHRVLRSHHDQLLALLDHRLESLSEQVAERLLAGLHREQPLPVLPLQQPPQQGYLGAPKGVVGGRISTAARNSAVDHSGNSGSGGRTSRPATSSKMFHPKEVDFEFHGRQDSALEKKGLRRIVEDSRFELFFGFAIITNAIYIGIQTDHMARNGSEESTVFKVSSLVYTLLFTIEIVLKMCNEGRQFFWSSPTLGWNYIDFVIVATSLLEGAVTVALWSTKEDEASQSTSQFRILRIIRVTRLIKVVRVTRIIKFIRALRTMVHQLLSTVKSLLWAMVLLCLIIYLFAILFTQFYTASREDRLPDGHNEDVDGALPIDRYWSTLPRSMFTLFQSITGGVSWEAVVTPLTDLGEVSVVLFVGYISFAQFAVLNVLTGVFCQNAIDSAQADQELVAHTMIANKQFYIRSLQTLFQEFDLDQSGSISIQEFVEHLNDDHVQAYFDALELDTSDIGLLFTLMNMDDDEELDLDEFVSGCLRLRGTARAVDVAKLTYMVSNLQKRLGRWIKSTNARGVGRVETDRRSRSVDAVRETGSSHQASVIKPGVIAGGVSDGGGLVSAS